MRFGVEGVCLRRNPLPPSLGFLLLLSVNGCLSHSDWNEGESLNTAMFTHQLYFPLAPAPGITTSYYLACPGIIGSWKCEVDLGMKVNNPGLRLTAQSCRDYIMFYVLQSKSKKSTYSYLKDINLFCMNRQRDTF